MNQSSRTQPENERNELIAVSILFPELLFDSAPKPTAFLFLIKNSFKTQK